MGIGEWGNENGKLKMGDEKWEGSEVSDNYQQNLFFWKLVDRKYSFSTFRTLKLLYDKVHCENSLAVVSVEYKIPEVYCH